MAGTLSNCLIVHQGGMEHYGLIYVAGEVKRLGGHIRWIDGDAEPFSIEDVVAFNPGYVLFSPMTFSFLRSLELCRMIKDAVPGAVIVFGGHHVSAVPGDAETDLIDYVVLGPVYGALEEIASGNAPKFIQGRQGGCECFRPVRREYYRDIPRITKQPVRYIMSHFGCPYNCSYCSTSRVRSLYGPREYNRMFLKRRPAGDLIEESRMFLEYPPREVFLADDDCLQGRDAEIWLSEFSFLWKRDIGLPVTTYISPFSLSRASDSLMRTVAATFPFVNMGVQSLSTKTLRLFNRSFQTEDVIRKAVGRLREFGVRARLELIFGAPCDDPVEDALFSLRKMQEIAPDFYCAAYALMVFPGTALYKSFREEGIPFSDPKSPFIHSGYTSVQYDDETREKIRKLTKLSHFFVSRKVDMRYMRAFLELDMEDKAALEISRANFFVSQRYKYGDIGESLAEDRMKNMQFSY